MFQFTGFPSIRYGLAYGYMRSSHVGFPIQKSPVIGYLLLPEAYRSLSRLSSALSAKASTLRSFLLASSDTIALISDGLLFLGFSTCSLLSQRLVSSLSLRLTYFRCFVYAVFKVQCSVFFRRPVEIKRFELSTPCLQGRCSPN